ncbi:MAG TPA: DUF3800 domain-containing protein [Kiritimatiellia bacterium]|nr:DUF3800 domain-containing protein [Kiritimatiellia bacterium]
MLFFFDETFRDSCIYKGTSLGALCGIAIPERNLARITTDIYQLKLKHLGADFARDQEIKGKELLKNWVFRLAAKGQPSKNLALASDLLGYITRMGLKVFGCVCFARDFRNFRCEDMTSLDFTFRYLFERIDNFMKIERPDSMAKLVFDDRDFETNRQNAEAITNFFVRSGLGAAMDSIIKTPFFAISQAQNVGLQLADFVATVIGLKFASNRNVNPYFEALKPAIYVYYDADGRKISGLKVIRGDKEKAPGGLAARGQDKKAQLPAHE